ncbi:Tyrosine-protein kinase [Trema orientale]|uniref:Tyrosine-protein kinase n=1 Tax=Trema orientale TaxID=63057 RepID=A0A2P5AVB4_TREOI|nr:Tyrosine-protein kinase [Trema orientale]
MEDSRGWFGRKFERLQRRFSSHSGKLEKERKRFLLKNGSKLLEELITCCKDKCRCNPIRSFSAKQVLEATNYFQSQFSVDYNSKWYKGTLDDRLVLVKKYHLNENNEAYRDIAISCQMSSHKNALKLLGCCLEFSDPVLVYEYAENGHLNSKGCIDFDGSYLSLPWKTRLKVAKDIANAITYLHTAYPRPIIHRDIQPSSIFLDKDYVPKLCNFNLCIQIPEGENFVEDAVKGTFGFAEPTYVGTGYITEHTDVYSFGATLLVLLTGQVVYDRSRPGNENPIGSYVANAVENERFDEVVDRKILEEAEIDYEVKPQVQAFVKLALRCIERRREDRPLILDVAKELAKIERYTNWQDHITPSPRLVSSSLNLKDQVHRR